MAEVRNPTEPSMEEILASIRRIIVEDNGPLPGTPTANAASAGTRMAAPAQSPRVAGSDVTTRTFPAPPPNVTPMQPPRAPPVQEAILDLTERIDDEDLVHRTAEALPPTQPSLPAASGGRLNRPPPLKAATAEPRIASDSTVAASVSALTKIAGIGQAVRQSELPLGDVGRTLEDMVRELLRPHMKEWLDANLPRLVERVVRDEIARLVRDAQER